MTDPKDMTAFQKLVEGLHIFERYLGKAAKAKCLTETIGIEPIGPSDFTKEDRDRLEALGWKHWDWKPNAWWFGS